MSVRGPAVAIAALSSVVVLLLGGCGDAPSPGYIRLSGESPAIPDAPVSRARLVVFWASWCAPCRTETPGLRALAERPPTSLSVVVFSQDHQMNAVRSFFGGDAPAALHLQIDEGARMASSFGVGALPTAVLVVDGRLVARFVGGRDWSSPAMRKLLERLISEPPGAGI